MKPARGMSALLVAVALAAAARAQAPQPLSPQAALDAFEVASGHVVELVAAEPLVLDPVALAWDDAGRLFVAEMGDYPKGEDGGRIVTLVDTDGDGRMDERRVFATGLPFPSGVLAWRGGVLVTSAPDILWLADADGDGVADTRKVVLTGFNPGNQQLRVNGLVAGPDGWIYAANGRSGGAVTSPLRPQAAPVSIDLHDLRFRPDTGEVEPVAGFSQFGLAFDAGGERYSNWNTAPFRHVVFPLDVAARHPLFAPPTDMEVLEDPLLQNRVFPISGPPTTFNREPTDAFNASCGLSIDTLGGLDPPGCAYVCEPLLNVVHRRELLPAGATVVARRPAGEEAREFLASRDPWFRPVFTAVAPDGALLICDFYRRWVEHPDFVAAELRAGVAWDEGKDRGRIWRVRREAAARAASPRPAARVPTPRAAGRRALATAGAELGSVAERLASEPDAAVRFEAVLAAERLPPEPRARVLAEALRAGRTDPWVERAVVCVVEEAAADVVGRLAGDVVGPGVLRRLAFVCGRRGDEDAAALSRVVEPLMPVDDRALAILAGWLEGRRSRGDREPPASFGGRGIGVWTTLARDASATVAASDDAVAVLAVDRSEESTAILLDLLAGPRDAAGVEGLLRSLRGRDDDRVVDRMVAVWPAASPAVRRAMLAALVAPGGFRAGLPRFVDAVAAGAIDAVDVDPESRLLLLAPDLLATEDRSRLETLLGGAVDRDRGAVVAAAEAALPASEDRTRGRELFARNCAACHRCGGVGARVGPELAGMESKPTRQFLEDILDPGKRLTGEYAAVTVVTHDGEAFTGLLRGESPEAVQLLRTEGRTETIPRSAIETFRGSRQSLMPEGFERSLTPADLADLIAFLRRPS
jgi:putative membrane-bound dehydrogenase-like protein